MENPGPPNWVNLEPEAVKYCNIAGSVSADMGYTPRQCVVFTTRFVSKLYKAQTSSNLPD
jgi:hypothetical protein